MGEFLSDSAGCSGDDSPLSVLANVLRNDNVSHIELNFKRFATLRHVSLGSSLRVELSGVARCKPSNVIQIVRGRPGKAGCCVAIRFVLVAGSVSSSRHWSIHRPTIFQQLTFVFRVNFLYTGRRTHLNATFANVTKPTKRRRSPLKTFLYETYDRTAVGNSTFTRKRRRFFSLTSSPIL